MRPVPTRARLTAVVTLALAAPIGASLERQAPAAAGPSETRIEIVAVDKDGRPLDSLRPEDLALTIDGAPRPVLSIRRVSRGPGAASDAARRLLTSVPGQSFAAEPSRSVMVVVDQTLLVRGDERAAVQAAGALLNRLGIGDRVGVLRLPMTGDQRLELTTERPASRDALALVRGETLRKAMAKADPLAAQMDRDAAGSVDPTRVGDPERTGEPERPRQEQVVSPSVADLAVNTPEADLALARSSIGGLLGLLKSMQPVPGRKVIALFSAGFVNAPPAQVMDAAAAAIAARATIYVFGLPAPQDDALAMPDVQALQLLARNTGGSFAMLGRNAERTVDRVMTELSTAFVVTVAAEPADADGRRRAIRVQTTRKDVTVRAPVWLQPSLDPGDVVAVPPEPAAEPTPASPGAGGATPPVKGGRETRPAAPSAKDEELQLALGRMFDYVEAYEKQYSALVAEEEYSQSSGQSSVRLRSDFLLVKQDAGQGWVSFRDVFEVNGVPVRDREDRLKRLFLDPGVQAGLQLMRIKEESARYNIGPLERNINVPLFQLKYLSPINRSRSKYKLAGRTESNGIQVWRIEFLEQERPTVVTDREEHDIPVSGYYLVEQGTGAIVETGLKIEERIFRAEIVVRYRLDPGLGMWVPSRMTETYRTARVTSIGNLRPGETWTNALEGRADYAKFRRFQVKTEETVAIPKK